MNIARFMKTILRMLPVLLILLPVWNAFSGQDGVKQAISNATSPFDHHQIEGVPKVTDKSIMALVKYQGGVFRTETRKDKIERFNCSQCHNNNPVTIAQAAKIAHGDITLDHGGKAKPLSCFTCHKKDERDYLIVETGMKVDMDHSYQLCGQCHFRQKMDWAGGAHGKRISNWAGERVVKNCVSCHNPHSPKFAKRWPTTYSPASEK